MIFDEPIERTSTSLQYVPAMLVLTGALAVSGVFSAHLLFLALAPLAIAVAIYLSRRAPFKLNLHDEGIEVVSPQWCFIRYEHIEAVCRDDQTAVGRHSYPLVVVHRDGLLNIPAGLSHSSRDLYRCLRERLPRRDGFSPPAELRPMTRFYDEKYGERRVWAYRCLPDPEGWRDWTGVAVCLALAAAAIGWICGSYIGPRFEDWLAVGWIGLLFFLVGFLYFMIKSAEDRGVKYIGDGGIVIAPEGFALKQGRLCGQMRWDEVAEVRYQAMPRSIHIEFDGGKVRLSDVYDHRLKAVYLCLLDHWEEWRGITRPKKVGGLPIYDQL